MKLTKFFLKHLASNVLQVIAMFGAIWSFGVVAENWLGVNQVWGFVAFMVLLFVYFIADRSWDQAKREQRDQ